MLGGEYIDGDAFLLEFRNSVISHPTTDPFCVTQTNTENQREVIACMEGLVLSLLTGPARNSTSRVPVPSHGAPCESAGTCIWSWRVGACHLHGHLASLLHVPVARAPQGPSGASWEPN